MFLITLVVIYIYIYNYVNNPRFYALLFVISFTIRSDSKLCSNDVSVSKTKSFSVHSLGDSSRTLCCPLGFALDEFHCSLKMTSIHYFTFSQYLIVVGPLQLQPFSHVQALPPSSISLQKAPFRRPVRFQLTVEIGPRPVYSDRLLRKGFFLDSIFKNRVQDTYDWFLASQFTENPFFTEFAHSHYWAYNPETRYIWNVDFWQVWQRALRLQALLSWKNLVDCDNASLFFGSGHLFADLQQAPFARRLRHSRTVLLLKVVLPTSSQFLMIFFFTMMNFHSAIILGGQELDNLVLIFKSKRYFSS